MVTVIGAAWSSAVRRVQHNLMQPQRSLNAATTQSQRSSVQMLSWEFVDGVLFFTSPELIPLVPLFMPLLRRFAYLVFADSVWKVSLPVNDFSLGVQQYSIGENLYKNDRIHSFSLLKRWVIPIPYPPRRKER